MGIILRWKVYASKDGFDGALATGNGGTPEEAIQELLYRLKRDSDEAKTKSYQVAEAIRAAGL